jgi:ABC-type proline/glycine betaine transport system permease subunit
MARGESARKLQGAVPAALLALGVQAVFDALEKRVVPKGLRMEESSSTLV